MDISKYSKYLSVLYTDKMTIYRTIETKDIDGSTRQIPSQIIADNVPCRLSFKNKDSALAKDQYANDIELSINVFCNSEIDIKKGDFVKVYRTETIIYQGRAGLPNIFPGHHTEFELAEVAYG